MIIEIYPIGIGHDNMSLYGIAQKMNKRGFKIIYIKPFIRPQRRHEIQRLSQEYRVYYKSKSKYFEQGHRYKLVKKK